MPLVVHHCTVKANNNSLGNRCRQFVDFSVVPWIAQSLPARTCNNVCGHVAIITETKFTYVMIESTFRFDDIEDIPGLLPLLQVVQRSRMWSRERSGRRPGSGARGGLYSNICLFLTICLHKHVDIVKSHDSCSYPEEQQQHWSCTTRIFPSLLVLPTVGLRMLCSQKH